MKTLLISASFACCTVSATPVLAQDHHGGAQAPSETAVVNAMCPVGNEPVVASAGTVEYKGKTIGTCCPGCGEAFLAWDEARKDEFVALVISRREPATGPADDGVPASATPPVAFELEQFGAMREVMRGGQTEPRARLSEMAGRRGAVGVGALAGLAGEVTIVDGEVWVSRASSDGVLTSGPQATPDDAATLLTLASVAEWRTLRIDTDDSDPATVVERAAIAAGLDLNRPFPFILKPESVELEIHVIKGFCPSGVDPSEAGTEPWRWAGEDASEIRIVGFYARDAAGTMTHHGSTIHAHAVLELNGETMTAHIDHASLSGTVVLQIPALAEIPDQGDHDHGG